MEATGRSDLLSLEAEDVVGRRGLALRRGRMGKWSCQGHRSGVDSDSEGLTEEKITKGATWPFN